LTHKPEAPGSSARSARQHKARGVSPGMEAEVSLARGAGDRCEDEYFLVRNIRFAITKWMHDHSRYQLSPAPRARHLCGLGSWGWRPRLYASARFAGWV